MSFDLGERFWSKVDKRGDKECWNWTGQSVGPGYGTMNVGRTTGYAHRLSYEAHVGPIPERLYVDHMCHNESCVNPGHLRVATNSQNQQNRRGAPSNSRSGVRNVTWNSRYGKWKAQTKLNGVSYHLGLFDTIAEADAVAVAWRRENMPYSLADRIKATS